MKLPSYTAYGIGCCLARAGTWIFVGTRADGNTWDEVLLAFVGEVSGWTFPTIPRSGCPPPRPMSSNDRLLTIRPGSFRLRHYPTGEWYWADDHGSVRGRRPPFMGRASVTARPLVLNRGLRPWIAEGRGGFASLEP
jgi:hypothetical protein